MACRPRSTICVQGEKRASAYGGREESKRESERASEREREKRARVREESERARARARRERARARERERQKFIDNQIDDCRSVSTTPLQGDTAAGHSWPSIGGEYYTFEIKKLKCF
jgi:hypothetical protein